MMKTLPLSTTGLQVSALCLGAMYFGSKNDQATSERMLDLYLNAGGTFIDTANIYAHWIEGFAGGESETLLGQWMRERGNRGRLFIATKVGFEYPGVDRTLTAKMIEAECHKSLKRLGIDTIDLYYAHVDDRHTPLDETLRAFDRLIQAGKVRYIGASNYLAWRLEEARWISQTTNIAGFCCIQQRYTYYHPKPGASFGSQLAVNSDLLDYSRQRQLTILAYSALLGGGYVRQDRPIGDQYISVDNDARYETLRVIAAETGATLNQVVLAWMLHHDPPVIPLIAASTDEQMKENLDALNIKLSTEQMQRLNEAAR